MENNHNDQNHYFILLRVGSEPRDLWQSLQGDVYTLPITRVNSALRSRAAAPNRQRKGDNTSCPLR